MKPSRMFAHLAADAVAPSPIGAGSLTRRTFLKANGLHKFPNGAIEDTQLEPHDWRVDTLTGPGTDYNGDQPGCGTPPPSSKPDASYHVTHWTGCTKPRRAVVVDQRHHVTVQLRHNRSRLVWHVKATAKAGHTFADGTTTDRRTVRLHVPSRCNPHPHGS